jgi:hypothetical protein
MGVRSPSACARLGAPAWSRVALLCAAFCGAGCQATPTQVLVVFDADEEMRSAAARLRIEVINQERGTAHWDVPIAPNEPRGTSFPVTLPLVPRGGDPTRTFDVVADLIASDDSLIARQRVSSGYVARELRVVRVQFDDACGGVLCDRGTTCRGGACVDSCVEPAPLDDRSIRGCPLPDGGTSDAGAPASGCEAHASAIFCDGFEQPLPDRWTRGVNEEGGVLTRVTRATSPVLSGDFSLEARTTETDPGARAAPNASTELSGIGSDLYVRLFVFVPSATPPTEGLNFAFAGERAGRIGGLEIGIEPDGAPFARAHDGLAPDARRAVIAPSPLAVDRWVCIEGHLELAESGSLDLFVDGVLRGHAEGFDTRAPEGITVLYAGIALGSGQPQYAILLDEIVVDDEFIGCD